MSSFIQNIIAHQTTTSSVVRPRLPGKFETPGFAGMESRYERDSEIGDETNTGSQIHTELPDAYKTAHQPPQQSGIVTAVNAGNSEWQKPENNIQPSPELLSANTGLEKDTSYLASGRLMQEQPAQLSQTAIVAQVEDGHSVVSHSYAKAEGAKTGMLELVAANAIIPGWLAETAHSLPDKENQQFNAQQMPPSALAANGNAALHNAQPLHSGIHLSSASFPSNDTAVQPIIKVSIGRIELRSGSNRNVGNVTAKRNTAANEQKPKMSLEDYLKSRNAAS